MWRRCWALPVEVTKAAEAELMLRPWHCRVSSAEHLGTTLNPKTEILKAVIRVGLILTCAQSSGVTNRAAMAVIST